MNSHYTDHLTHMQVYLQDTFTIAGLLGQKLHMFIILITAVQLPYIGIELTFYFSFFFCFFSDLKPHLFHHTFTSHYSMSTPNTGNRLSLSFSLFSQFQEMFVFNMNFSSMTSECFLKDVFSGLFFFLILFYF